MGEARFTNKVVVVTGGATGIGRATVERFVAEGASVLIADVQDAVASDLAQSLGQRVAFQHCDVSKASEVEAAVAAAVARFGGVDVFVNNAGIEHGAPLAETSAEDFARVLSINVLGIFNGIKAATPAIAARGGGAIVNTASIAGLTGSAMMGPYSASKAAAINLTQTAALELRPLNIRVNCVCPGFIQTPMLQRLGGDLEKQLFGMDVAALTLAKQQRLGAPQEIADAIVYLASAQASFVNGHAMVVDNGCSLSMI